MLQHSLQEAIFAQAPSHDWLNPLWPRPGPTARVGSWVLHSQGRGAWRVRHWQPNKIEFKEKVHYISIRRKVELKNVLSKSRVKSDKSPWPPLSIKWFAIGVFSSVLPPPCTAQRMLLFTLYFLRSPQFWLLLTKSLTPFTVFQELQLTLGHVFLTRNFLNRQETLVFCFFVFVFSFASTPSAIFYIIKGFSPTNI